MTKEFPGASYDNWKTTDPRDSEPEPDPEPDPIELYQCDNCQIMFDPDEDGCFIGWHKSYGDCCQCSECVQKARAEAGFPFSGSF